MKAGSGVAGDVYTAWLMRSASSHVESIVICILRLTAYNVIKRAVKGVADGYNIRKLNGIGYASKKFTQRSERDPRHPGELFVCYLFF